MMADYEYTDAGARDWTVRAEQLQCSICHTLAVQPVRVVHRGADCGALACLACHRAWTAASGPDALRCPLCRGACATAGEVAPDPVLQRLLGSLGARCAHCGLLARVEDMTGHLRGCAERRLCALRRDHTWRDLRSLRRVCRGTGECDPQHCRWAAVVANDLLPALPDRVRAYLREWIAEVVTSGEAYMFTQSFRTLCERCPALVLELWEGHWAAAPPPCGGKAPPPSGPGAPEVVHVFEVLPAPHGVPLVRRLEGLLAAALRRAADPEAAAPLAVLRDLASHRLLHALDGAVWSALDAAVFGAAAGGAPAAVVVDAAVFALTHGFLRREREWSSADAQRVVGYGPRSVGRDALAGLLAHAFRTPGMGPALVPALAHEWRTRAICEAAYPLPRPGTEAFLALGADHALAYILAAGSPGEVVSAARELADAPGGSGYGALNQVLVAFAQHGGQERALASLARDPVARLLATEPALSVAVPAALALALAPSDTDAARVADLLAQGHRLVAVHTRLAISWMDGFVGYALLLLRTGGGASVAAALRVREGTGHNAVVSGLLLSRATAMPLPAAAEPLRVGLVSFVLAVVQGQPVHGVVQGGEGLGGQALRAVLAARTRPLLQEGLRAARAPADAVLRPAVLRFLAAIAVTVPAAWEWMLRVPAARWTPDAVAVILDHARLVDHFVWCQTLRPGFPALTLQTVLDDPRYRRRDWQAVVRLHARAPWAAAPRRAGPGVSVLETLVGRVPASAAAVADALRVTVIHGLTPLVLQWWCASRADEDAVAGDVHAWPEMRAWVAARVWEYAARYADAADRFDARTAARLLDILRGGELPGRSAFALLTLHGDDAAWAEACALALRRWPDWLTDAEEVLAFAVRRAAAAGDPPQAVLAACATMAGLSAAATAARPPAALLDRTDFGVLVAGAGDTEALLSRAAVRGRLWFWARCLLRGSGSVSLWLGTRSAVVDEDGLGALGGVLARLAAGDADADADDPEVLAAAAEALRYVGEYTSRLSEADLPREVLDSDLGHPVAHAVALLARQPVHFDAWAVLADTHPTHLADTPPDALCALLDAVDGGGARHAAGHCLRILAHWVAGFGASIDHVWRRFLAPREAALRRICDAAARHHRPDALTVQGFRDFAERFV